MGLWRRDLVVRDDTITNAVQLTLRQSIVPNLLVTILFFLWGFAYGLLDVLNSHFQKELSISASMASGLSAAYFGAYFVCPLTISGWLLRRFGYRVTFMTGLAVFAVGCLLFWPSGLKKSFGGFCGSMFVVGVGLATLETAADPFLSVCGPPRYSEIRLNLAQAINGVGTTAAPLLASRVFFAKTVDDEQGLKNVQWVYLGVACFVGLLVVLFLLAPMPEITDADMGAVETAIGDIDPGPFRKQHNLFLAVWAEFCYVGAQVSVANYFINFCEEAGRTRAHVSPNESSDLLAVGQGLYTFNRFIASFLLMLPSVKPRYMLATYLGLSFVFAVAASQSSGTASIAMLILVICAESCCFATIFTLGLRGLGRHTKFGASLLVASVSGGMVFPPITGAVVDRRGAHTAMLIPMTAYILACIYPLYVNMWKRELMDVHRTTNVGVEPVKDKTLPLEAQSSAADKATDDIREVK